MKVNELFQEKVFTISNLISIIRVILIPFLGYVMYYEYNHSGFGYLKYWELFIFLLMSLSDFLDGYLARRFNQQSKLGQFLDPMADKITAVSVGSLLFLYKGYPGWILIFGLSREILVIIISIFLFSKKDIQVKPNIFGKMCVGFMSMSAIVYIMDVHHYIKDTTIALIFVFYILGGIAYLKTYSGFSFAKKKDN